MFTHKQQEELKAAFSQIKNLQKALPLKLNLREITVRVWLQDVWAKLIKTVTVTVKKGAVPDLSSPNYACPTQYGH